MRPSFPCLPSISGGGKAEKLKRRISAMERVHQYVTGWHLNGIEPSKMATCFSILVERNDQKKKHAILKIARSFKTVTQRVNNHLSENPIATKIQHLCTEPFWFRVGRKEIKNLSVRAGSSLHSDIRPLKKKKRLGQSHFLGMCFPFIPSFQWTAVCVNSLTGLHSFEWTFVALLQRLLGAETTTTEVPNFSVVSTTQLILLFATQWNYPMEGLARVPSDHSNPALSQTSKLFPPPCTLSAK